ncbi:MAG: hypothetical protein R6V35_03365 [Candidatus Nanohaloarchaea archaeon]
MKAKVVTPDYISGRVEGEVMIGNQAYNVRGTDYGTSFHLKVDGEDCSYSDTHNYSDINSLENSNSTLKELFDLAKDNIQAWNRDNQILYVGERELDDLCY